MWQIALLIAFYLSFGYLQNQNGINGRYKRLKGAGKSMMNPQYLLYFIAGIEANKLS